MMIRRSPGRFSASKILVPHYFTPAVYFAERDCRPRTRPQCFLDGLADSQPAGQARITRAILGRLHDDAGQARR